MQLARDSQVRWLPKKVIPGPTTCFARLYLKDVPPTLRSGAHEISMRKTFRSQHGSHLGIAASQDRSMDAEEATLFKE